jgi:hypothetical protein
MATHVIQPDFDEAETPQATGAEGFDQIFKGTGTPESIVTADVGALYLQTDGAVGLQLWQKQSGTGTTGWVNSLTLSTFIAGSVSTDTIVEKTASAGVTIETVTLEDGVLVAGALRSIGSILAPAIYEYVVNDGVNIEGVVFEDGGGLFSATTTVGGSGVSTDAVIERSTNAGVTVDGVLIKDSIVTPYHVIESTSSPAAFTNGNNNNFDAGTAAILRCTAASGASNNITGIVAGVAGRRIVIINIDSTGTIGLMHEDANSSEANRFIGLNGNSNVTLGVADTAEIMYDAVSAKWRILNAQTA